MINADYLFVVEWSPTQKCVHIQSLKDSLAKNRAAVMTGAKSDWLTILVTDSRQEAHDFAAEIQNWRDHDEEIQQEVDTEYAELW